MPYIFFRTTIEIIKADDIVTIVHKSFAKMRTDKSGTTRYKDSFHI